MRRAVEHSRARGQDACRRYCPHRHSRHALGGEDTNSVGIAFSVADAISLPFAESAFDFVTAFMSLTDIPDQAQALREARRVLRAGGFLQFSILHPRFVPPHRRVLREADRTTRAIEVGRYFENRTTGRVDTWWFETLPREECKHVTPF